MLGDEENDVIMVCFRKVLIISRVIQQNTGSRTDKWVLISGWGFPPSRPRTPGPRSRLLLPATRSAAPWRWQAPCSSFPPPPSWCSPCCTRQLSASPPVQNQSAALPLSQTSCTPASKAAAPGGPENTKMPIRCETPKSPRRTSETWRWSSLRSADLCLTRRTAKLVPECWPRTFSWSKNCCQRPWSAA